MGVVIGASKLARGDSIEANYRSIERRSDMDNPGIRCNHYIGPGKQCTELFEASFPNQQGGLLTGQVMNLVPEFDFITGGSTGNDRLTPHCCWARLITSA